MTKIDKRILNRLQEDIPFIARPWEAVAKDLGVTEELLLKRIAFLKKKGIIRRISAVFSPRKIGLVSTLAAIKTSPASARKVAQQISSYPEVTHNYKRDAEYNIWFTIVAGNAKNIAKIISEIRKNKAVKKLAEFPMVRLFKIDVNFRI
jgi:siroheme decarboxylase